MVTLAIDDMLPAAQQIRGLMTEIDPEGHHIAECDPEGSLSSVEQEKPDIVWLDIEMPGFSGMDVAGKIKPYLPDVKIIFITSHIEYAIDAFELSIFRYVPKYKRQVKLPAAVKDAIKLLTLEGGKVYAIQSAGRLEKIPYKDILYIRKEGKNAELIDEKGNVTKVRKSLQQVFDELGSEEFIFTDRGCIVNIIHVMQIKDSEAVMKNGEHLPVSRSHLQDVKLKINAYWGEHI